MSTRNWMSSSVRRIGGRDPVATIRRKAQDLALHAIDQGWNGPPFDPLELARLLGHTVIASVDVKDARLVPTGSKATIEYNPSVSPARARFSVAHEIAHTLFADWATQTRNRIQKKESGSDWEIELLCNVGAAELLMPLSLLQEEVKHPTIEAVLKLRERYQVSTEAIAIRLVDVGKFPVAAFACSRRGTNEEESRYAIDYFIGAVNAEVSVPVGTLLPTNTLVRECTAVGTTTVGSERWPVLGRIHLEATAVPAYPGHIYPRVIGIVTPEATQARGNAEIRIVRGDAVQPRDKGPKVVAHVVNDKTPNWGGAGFASGLRRKWPDVQNDFRTFATTRPDEFQLGAVRFFKATSDTWVASMVAQKGYGESKRPRLRYTHLRDCLQDVARFAASVQGSVHMPKIGTGYGGGDWSIIKQIIETTLIASGFGVTVYLLPTAQHDEVDEQVLLKL